MDTTESKEPHSPYLELLALSIPVLFSALTCWNFCCHQLDTVSPASHGRKKKLLKAVIVPYSRRDRCIITNYLSVSRICCRAGKAKVSAISTLKKSTKITLRRKAFINILKVEAGLNLVCDGREAAQFG